MIMIDVLVTGRSLPALQAALDLAEVGLTVAVAAPSELEGAEPESERDPAGAITEFMARIAQPIVGDTSETAASIREQSSQLPPPMLRNFKGEWRPQPEVQVLGIPAVPIASEVVELIGSAAASRAFLDRVKPLLTIGKTRELGRLVRNRMGNTLLERLVEPQVFERYGVPADEVDVAIASPGLNEAVSRAGALSSGVLAYSDRNVARETWVRPAGGFAAFHAEALQKLACYGVQLLDASVVGMGTSTSGWIATFEDGAQLAARAIVADLGRSPLPLKGLGPLVQGVLPARARVYAEIDIECPNWLSPGGSALTRYDDWSVSFGAHAADSSSSATLHARMRLASGVFPVSEASERQSDQALSTVIDGLRLSGIELVEADHGSVRGSELTAAPYATVAECDSAEAAREAAMVAHDTLLPVGRALHGDDLGASLVWAHSAAVTLRRRLLGLSIEQ